MESHTPTMSRPSSRWSGSSEYQRLVFSLLAGFLVTLGLPPVPWTGLLVPVGLAWFFAQLTGARKPALVAWTFGLAQQLSLLHWLFLLIPAKSIPTRALVPIQALAAIGYVTLFYLVFGWLFGRVRARLGGRAAMLTIPVLFTAMEVLRDRGELAFPWCLSGSAVIGTPLMALLRTGGELGVGAGIVFSAAAGAALLRRDDSWRLLARGAVFLWLVLAAGALVGGSATTGPTFPVAAVQADVSLDVKWDPARLDATTAPYARFTEEAATGGARFVVWAETALPAYVRYDRDLMEWVRDLVKGNGVWLYTGFPDAQREPDGALSKFNSSGLFNAQGLLVDRYAKHHLLPIGEAMPFTRFFPALARIDVGQAEWAPGPPPSVMRAVVGGDSLSFSGLICFESILGRQARQSVRLGSRCLVVLTNDGWFGRTAGPRQHAALARLRAAECGVPLIRCANNGISLICDDRGRLLDRLDLGRAGVVRADITPGTGRTLFVRLGNAPLLFFLLLWSVLVLALPGKDLAHGSGAPR